MDAEAVAPVRSIPWRGLLAATLAAALGAFGLNLGLGRVLVMGLPEGPSVGSTPPGELLAEGSATDPTSAPGGGAVAEGSLPPPAPGEVDVDGATAPGDAPGRALPATRRSEADYRNAILGRNLFDAAKIGVKDDECIGEDCPVIDEPKLDFPGMLTGTMVSDVPAYSAAFILEDGKTSAMAYGIGQKLGDAELVEILDDRVRLRRGTDEQWLILGQKHEAGSKTTSASTDASADAGAPAEGGVTKNSETSFTIDKALWESKMGDLSSLTREARALLHRGPDGNYDGYRLSAIRRGSLADQLGIKNGDIIHDVNGQAIDSVDAAMKAFDELRSGSNFQIKVTRRGQPVSLDYAVK